MSSGSFRKFSFILVIGISNLQIVRVEFQSKVIFKVLNCILLFYPFLLYTTEFLSSL